MPTCWRCRCPVAFTNRGVGGIDGTVSSAVGAALASRWPGYAIMGDLTFLHDANGLLIGPDEPRPDLCVIVLNDDGGGIFGLLEPGAPEHAGVFERVFGTPHGVDIAALCAATRTPHEVVEVEACRCPCPPAGAPRRRSGDRPARTSGPFRPASHRGGRSPRLSVAAGQPDNASRIGISLAALSPSSASGSEPATMPQPANSRSRAGSSGSMRAQRSAIPHSPSPAASIQPTGPAYRPRSFLDLGYQRSGGPVGVPQTAAVGCNAAASASGSAAPRRRP